MRLSAGWLSAGIAALLLTAGCKRPEESQREARQAEQQAQQAEQQAQQAQQQAQQAEQQSQQAQQQAQQAQQQATRVIVGDVLTASENEVLVSSRGEPQVRLQVGPQTQVYVDGQKASPVDIREGSQVRASYQQQDGEPTALRIDVTSAQQPPAPVSPKAGESPQAVPPAGEPPVQQ